MSPEVELGIYIGTLPENFLPVAQNYHTTDVCSSLPSDIQVSKSALCNMPCVCMYIEYLNIYRVTHGIQTSIYESINK